MPAVPYVEIKIGTDHRLEYPIASKATGLPIDITGWVLSWMAKRRQSDLDAAAVLTKTTAGGGITITGVFNADPALNAQVARVTIADDDTAALEPYLYVCELKRIDPGFETILSSGMLNLDYAVHRA